MRKVVQHPDINLISAEEAKGSKLYTLRSRTSQRTYVAIQNGYNEGYFYWVCLNLQFTIHNNMCLKGPASDTLVDAIRQALYQGYSVTEYDNWPELVQHENF